MFAEFCGFGPGGISLANAAFFGQPRALKFQVQRLKLDQPAMAPMAHARFCLQYPGDCKVRPIVFRGGPAKLTEARREQLRSVNTEVNRAIRPQANMGGVKAERWLIAPRAGDCNDYAVTKRHQLIAQGWPAHALLLAEVVIASGEHHLVLVARTDEGDLVLDNLNANIRPWTATRYRWVRVQSPKNPLFWATLARPAA
ncbi:transglutaminase-like cysteine peptidase [Rhodovulum sp. PH10]|uniref:transglutaminase-like cysteine peptidase n=1 Tax=Rhodovulum sp. PH10 TaxID=1187851 RepID=UPI001ED96B46|nr:transglutaminase-like cysteine peptidase [Rhodovulum sp. PH10]